MKTASILIVLIAATSSKWDVVSKKDPMTGVMEVVATIAGDRGHISFLCDTGSSEHLIVFQPHGFLGGRIAGHEWRDFMYRFDEARPVHTRWKYTKKVAVSPSKKETAIFLRLMMTRTKLTVRAIGYDNTYHDASFDLSGASNVLGGAASSCRIRPT